MNSFNSKRSTDDEKNLIEQLRGENAALRDKSAALADTCQTLRDQLAVAETEKVQAQAELSTLTDAAQVLQDDRQELGNTISELQAAVDRLTDMLWGRRSEKRHHGDQPTLFDPRMLPDHWARANPALVCHDRLRERADVAERKQIRYLRNQLAKNARREDTPSPAEAVHPR